MMVRVVVLLMSVNVRIYILNVNIWPGLRDYCREPFSKATNFMVL